MEDYEELHSPLCDMESPWNYLSRSHATHVIDAINELRKNKELCDVILVVDEHCIPAHRLILSACSPYFHGLFEGHDHNSLPLGNHPIEVPLSGVDPYAAESAINYCYTSELLIDDDSVWSLLPAASLLQLEEVQNVCANFLRGRLSLSNCVRMRLMASACHCEELISISEEYIELKFEELISSEEGLGNLTEENLSAFLSQLLTKQQISEDQVNDAIKHWVDRDLDNRSKKLRVIAKKLPCVNKKFKVDATSDHESDLSMDVDSNTEECPICCLLLPSKYHLHAHFKQQHADTAIASDFNQSFLHEAGEEGGEKRPQGSADLVCEICSKHYNSDIDMANHCLGHMEGFSPAPPSANIETCSASEKPQRTPSIPNNSHRLPTTAAFLKTIKGEKKYKCKLCGEETATEKEMYIHCGRHCSIEPPFQCQVCTKNFPDKVKMLKHLVHHSTIVYFCCPYCDKQSRTKANLQIHLRIHTGERPFVCSYCSKGFRNYCVLKVHIRSHTGEKPFKCELCGQSFTKNIHLKRHVSTHSRVKPFACDICGKGFGRNDHLQRHIKTIHTQDKPHQCSLCGKDFVRRYELDRHMRHHLKKGQGQESSTEAQPDATMSSFDHSSSSLNMMGNDSGMSTLDLYKDTDGYNSTSVISPADGTSSTKDSPSFYGSGPTLIEARAVDTPVADNIVTGPFTSTPNTKLSSKPFARDSGGITGENPLALGNSIDNCRLASSLMGNELSPTQGSGYMDRVRSAVVSPELSVKQNGSSILPFSCT